MTTLATLGQSSDTPVTAPLMPYRLPGVSTSSTTTTTNPSGTQFVEQQFVGRQFDGHHDDQPHQHHDDQYQHQRR